jgi:hypothetical protein
VSLSLECGEVSASSPERGRQGTASSAAAASASAARRRLPSVEWPVSSPGAPAAPLYCDAKVANRGIRVWHFVIENGY